MTQEERWRLIRDAQDDCLIAIEKGAPVPTAALAKLPPFRAAMLARIAHRAAMAQGYRALEQGTAVQVADEASRVMRGAELTGEVWPQLGQWWRGN